MSGDSKSDLIIIIVIIIIIIIIIITQSATKGALAKNKVCFSINTGSVWLIHYLKTVSIGTVSVMLTKGGSSWMFFCGLLSPRCAIIKVLMSMEFKRLRLTQKKKRIEASPPRLEVSRSLSSAGSQRVLWSAKTRVFTRREEHARLSCPHPITAQCCKRAPADWTLWRGGILSALMCRFFQVVGTSKVPHTLW